MVYSFVHTLKIEMRQLVLLFILVPIFLKGQVVLTGADGAVLATSDGKILTADCGSFVVNDVDGHTYNTVRIGTQCWLGKNLATAKYNDGTPIPNVSDNTAWGALATGAYCDYDNTPANSITYGKLYNWYAVDNNASTKFASNGGKNICPTGWHVPSSAEVTILMDFLGGQGAAGGKMKETGTAHWHEPNTGATNLSGFTALPGGSRVTWGGGSTPSFEELFYAASFWTTQNEWEEIDNMSGTLWRSYNFSQLGWGCSVRCLSD